VQQNCRQEKEEEEETDLFDKKLAFVKGNQNKNKVLNTSVKKEIQITNSNTCFVCENNVDRSA
jgi:hypothetical protein